MNINLPEKEKVSKKTISLYIFLVLLCVFAIIIAISIQVLGNDIINNFFGINKLIERTEQEENALKNNFINIFDNAVMDNSNLNIAKKDNSLEIVYTSYSKQEKNDNYEININLPYINIVNNQVQKFNEKVINNFESKSEEILNSESNNTIYTVKYKANISNKILSLIVYSDLKQGTNAQKVIIETFNYDLENNKILTLEDILNIYNLNKYEVQNKIETNIKKEQAKAEELIKLGYNVFSRDTENGIYDIENIEDFFIHNGNIYIIFAYGNYNSTSEMDLVII